MCLNICRAQETENTLLQGQLDKIAEDVCGIQQRQATLLDQLKECNRKQRQMAHRVLQLVVKQECHRKRGVPIDGAEEQLRIRLEALQSQLMAPTQYMVSQTVCETVGIVCYKKNVKNVTKKCKVTKKCYKKM